ncbi:MAG: pyridoxal phosphate-dependent aminotransferase [Gemmatimonadaceae bacterium]
MPQTLLTRNFSPSPNIAGMQESATIAVSARARALRAAGRNVIDLGAGEPDFDTPEFIRRAAQRAIDAGATKYTATEGILPLREAIASQANSVYTGQDSIDPREVVVSTGSKQSLFNTCFALFGDGDEVLIPTPAWTSYYEMVGLARATPVSVRGDPARGLKVSAEDLSRAASPSTRGLMLNSPCNPTGAVYTHSELKDILSIAEDHGWWVISDEIYDRVSYSGRAASTLDVATSRDRLVVINGVAKAYAMTGWRIGWAIAPRSLAQACAAFQSHTTSNSAAVSQHAALAALTDRAAAEVAIAAMVDEFRRRRDAALQIIAEEHGLQCIPPEGAFYLFLNVGAAIRGNPDAGSVFARELLERHDVAVVPGVAFGSPSWIRMSYAALFDSVVSGAKSIVSVFRELAT